MKISAVIAAYNGAKYISGQLESIAAQTRKVDEIIISDDHSTDNTKDAVSDFKLKHPDISVKYSLSPSHCGIDGNFANGITLASGDVIFLCDQDDVWLEDRVELMMEAFENSSAPCGTFCDSRVVDADLNDLGYTHWQSRGFGEPEEVFENNCAAFLKRVPPAGHDMAFSAKFKDILLPFPELPNCYDTWIGLVLYALGAWKCSTTVPLTLFRRHSESATKSGLMQGLRSRISEAKKAISDDSSLWYAKLYAELIERTGSCISAEMRQNLEARRCHSLARHMMNVPFCRRVVMVCRELFNGNYWRFGRKYQSVIQDLFMRHP